jgi:hypothetical protein
MPISGLDRDSLGRLLTALNHLKRFLVSHGAEIWGFLPLIRGLQGDLTADRYICTWPQSVRSTI